MTSNCTKTSTNAKAHLMLAHSRIASMLALSTYEARQSALEIPNLAENSADIEAANIEIAQALDIEGKYLKILSMYY